MEAMQSESLPITGAKRQRARTLNWSDGVHARLQHAQSDGRLHHMGCSPELRLKTGEVLHSVWFETFVVVLATIELGITLVEAGIDHKFMCVNAVDFDEHHLTCESREGPQAAALLETFGTVGRVIVSVFATEMALKLLVGQMDLFHNLWHVFDLLVVTVNFMCAFVFSSLAEGSAEEYASLLLFLRCWRVVKIFNLCREEKSYIEAKDKADSDDAAVRMAARNLCKQYGVAIPEELSADGPSSALDAKLA
eukprot:TRINITY_DN29437_c0_g1_i1.p1 TRINITY_DN29437_c0_g1~~TRINITY_DN29437_c0_g1_i1.p1  ORF type:complete len:274 (+),score=70.66 TRINITY_DN29437_c0_g1_i1:70-822(+)